MTVSALIDLIPPGVFADLAAETSVDHQVKKLNGALMFKLILFSMLNSEKLSLRVMETFLQSATFKSFANVEELDSKYNSIRDRISTINYRYFEELYAEVFKIYNKELKEEDCLSKADSTYVGLASKLFMQGMKNGDKDKRFIKYSVTIKGCLPCSVKIFTAQAYVSEDLALGELINEDKTLVNNVVVYDRGLQSRKEFDNITENNKWFVTRGRLATRCKIVAEQFVPEKPTGSTVTITKDITGYLINKKEQKTANLYRVIEARIDQTNEPICFVTNILKEDVYQVASWYKQRWEIELFFKFIKQHLNVKHLVSRNENGIKVMIFMTMILAILLIAFRKLNNIKSFKIAKLRFEIELENEIMQAIVILCGGDPGKAAHLWNKT